MDQLKTILLLEDEPAAAHLIKKTLQLKLLNPLRVLEQPAEVIDYLGGQGEYANRALHPFPLLLILDVKVSDKSGLEVLEWCKGQENVAAKDLPVAILTHLLDTAMFRDVYCLGANAFFSKPFDYNEFDLWVRESKKLVSKTIPGGRFIDTAG